jgi:hypothetical protein
MSKPMTRDEFIRYANEATDWEALEGLYEVISEHNGEVARFGDSWPGAMVRIQSQIADVQAIERQLARLEGRAPRDFHFRVSSPR